MVSQSDHIIIIIIMVVVSCCCWSQWRNQLKETKPTGRNVKNLQCLHFPRIKKKRKKITLFFFSSTQRYFLSIPQPTYLTVFHIFQYFQGCEPKHERRKREEIEKGGEERKRKTFFLNYYDKNKFDLKAAFTTFRVES